jgi:hypothetical protein
MRFETRCHRLHFLSMLFSRPHFRPAWFLALALIASPGLVAFATSLHGDDGVTGGDALARQALSATPSETVKVDVAGQDADGNGVRDDVDAFVAQQYARDPELRHAALRMARSLQQVLAVDLAQVDNTAPMAEREVAVMSCVIRQLGVERRGEAEQMINRIATRTYDTRERFEQREAFRLQASAADFSGEANCAPEAPSAMVADGGQPRQN